MKFLCVACDEPMKIDQAASAEGGTMNVVYECPECFSQIAMLTNPWETEVVQSLGVKIGPDGEKEAGKCPFSGIVQEMQAPTPGPTSPDPTVQAGCPWTPEALDRLKNIPEFVRPMARQGIEHYAKSEGYPEIDEKVLDEARGKFGM